MKKHKNPIILAKLILNDAGAKGMAVGKSEDGRVVFVPYGAPGDVVDVQIYKKKRRYLEGKIIHFHTYSTQRVSPVCKHFGTCGGCKWQHLDYDMQLFYKQQEVINNLQRLGGLTLPDAMPIKSADPIYYYRNKMEFSFSNARWLSLDEIRSETPIEDRNALGFHFPGMWNKVIHIETCHLQAEPSNAIRQAVKAYALANNLSFFDLTKQTGFLRNLIIRNSSLGDLMVLVQFYEENKVQREGLLDHLLQNFPITSLLYTINPKGNDALYDLTINCYAGKDHIVEEMEGLRFKIGAKSFYQTNSDQAYTLYKIVRHFASLTGEECVYDLYTGTGTIAQFISNQARKVVGVEAVPEAIASAKENALINKVSNCTFYCGDMKDIFCATFIQQNGMPDVIITDPPRDGMHPKVIEQILRILPKRIVYVSCNSATQARDLSLMKHQYEVKRMQAVDMFPQTHHVESVVLLEKIDH